MVIKSRFFGGDLFGSGSEFSRGGLSATLAAGHLCRVEGGESEGEQGQRGILKAGPPSCDSTGAEGWTGEDGKIRGLAAGRAPTL